MKILFSGGGTLGPVTPLLAMCEHLEGEDMQFIWVGTEKGIEEALVEQMQIPFFALPASKLRRYFSWQSFLDIFTFVEAFFKSFGLLRRERPDVCISAGGYVSVPLHLAAWILRIPTWIHQQDVLVGLANRIMSPFASLITVTLEQSLKYFPHRKTRLLGNPVRPSILSGQKDEARTVLGLQPNLPIILATGGGTGSEKINMLIAHVALELDDICQIIHLTGTERKIQEPDRPLLHYHSWQFLGDKMKDAYAASDIIVSRGGFGTLSEMASLKKAAVVIPKSGHQEKNVQFCVQGQGIVALDEDTLSAPLLSDLLRSLLQNSEQRQQLGNNLHTLIPSASKEALLDCLLSLQKKHSVLK